MNRAKQHELDEITFNGVEILYTISVSRSGNYTQSFYNIMKGKNNNNITTLQTLSLLICRYIDTAPDNSVQFFILKDGDLKVRGTEYRIAKEKLEEIKEKVAELAKNSS